MSGAAVLSKRYQLISQLGAGGMGSVWRARDLTLDADVAVKLMDPKLVGSAVALARFRREARSAAAIRSSYVVQILDHGVDGEIPFIAMELLQGESLAHRLKRTKTLSPEVTARVLGHVGRALSLAHEQGIVHRDLKPDNIFLVREGDEELGKVLDFGIARRNEGLVQNGGLETQTGAILGTPFYMSPEQACADAVDARSDIWAYGVVACECLAGKRPFQAESLGGLFRAICMDPLPIPSQLASVPRGFDEWFARATAREVAARYASIAEAASELRSLCLRPAGSSADSSASRDSGATLAPALAEAPTAAFEQTAPAAALSVAKDPPARSHRTRWLLLAAGLLGAAGYFGVRTISVPTQSISAKASADKPTVPLVSTNSPVVTPQPPTGSAQSAPVSAANVSAAPSTAPAATSRSVATIRAANPRMGREPPLPKPPASASTELEPAKSEPSSLPETPPTSSTAASPSSSASGVRKPTLQDQIRDRR